MPVTPDEIVERHPVLYHMAAPGSWPSIRHHGLLSTSALLDLFEVTATRRLKIEQQHRPEGVPIAHPAHGLAIVRDQKPMDDRGLERALAGTGLSPRDWYIILNRNVFFWVERERLERMMNARAYRNHPKTVLYVSTAELLERHVKRVLLAPMNTGCTKPMPHARGPDTFQPMNQYTRRRETIVELAVQHAVPDIRDLVVRVEEVKASGEATVVFER